MLGLGLAQAETVLRQTAMQNEGLLDSISGQGKALELDLRYVRIRHQCTGSGNRPAVDGIEDDGSLEKSLLAAASARFYTLTPTSEQPELQQVRIPELL